MARKLRLHNDAYVTGLGLGLYNTNGAMVVFAVLETSEGPGDEVISVNLPADQIVDGCRELAPGCFYAKSFEEEEGLYKALVGAGWVEPTGQEAAFNGLLGSVAVPVCRLTDRGRSMATFDICQRIQQSHHQLGGIMDEKQIEEQDEDDEGAMSRKDEWWGMVNDNWANLAAICERFLPMGQPATKAPFDFAGGRGIYKPVSKANPRVAPSLREDMLRSKRGKDARLSQYFHAAWAEAPDDRSIYGIPGWSVLCTLCERSVPDLNE